MSSAKFRHRLEDLATQHVRIGITGFSRSGKTVFLGALTLALLRMNTWKTQRGNGPLARFAAYERGQISGARVRDDIESHLPNFPFEQVRESLCQNAHWPEPTTGISKLFIDLDASPTQSRIKKWLATKGGMTDIGLGKVRVEFVDYPGEWLIDLPMLTTTYADWSASTLQRAEQEPRRAMASSYLKLIAELTPDAPFTAELTTKLASAWTEHLQQAADQGFTFNQPGRLLRPDTMLHSPVLNLVPIPAHLAESVLYKGMTKRYKDYCEKVVRQFYKRHFAKMDRQVLLVDVLGSLQKGEPVFNEMTLALREVMHSFQYGKGGLLSWLGFTKTTHVLFAATKADHVTKADRANLVQLLDQLLNLVDDKNQITSRLAEYRTIALAAVRASEDYRTESSPKRDILRGKTADDEQPTLYDPGGLPLDFPPDWNDMSFRFIPFEPHNGTRARQEGFQALDLGRALNFLVGDYYE